MRAFFLVGFGFLLSSLAFARINPKTGKVVQIWIKTCDVAVAEAKKSSAGTGSGLSADSGAGSAGGATSREAIEICQKSTKALCDDVVAKSGGEVTVHNSEWWASSCALKAAVGANKAVHKDKLTTKCKSASERAMNSQSAADADDSAKLCLQEVDSTCVKADTGGQEACRLSAALGAYKEVQSLAGKTSESKSDGTADGAR